MPYVTLEANFNLVKSVFYFLKVMKKKRRHLSWIPRIGLINFLNIFVNRLRKRWKSRVYNKMLQLSTVEDKFTEIYKQNLWSSDESLSGEGSELSYTQPLRNWLVINLPKLGVKDFVDAPCGDFNWMKTVVGDVHLNYVGIDIVREVVNKNNRLYGSSRAHFFTADIRNDEIPECDLLMVRDCLFHLSFDDIELVLKNINLTEYKYLLTTSHLVAPEFQNKNIRTGDFRLINLFSAPFCFSEQQVLDRVRDCPVGYSPGREMLLIEKRFVPTKLTFK